MSGICGDLRKAICAAALKAKKRAPAFWLGCDARDFIEALMEQGHVIIREQDLNEL